MKKVRLAACAVALSVGGLTPLGLSPADADTAATAVASAFGANSNIGGTTAIDKAGLATATLPPGQDVGPNQLLLVPVVPIAVNGTAVGMANAHAASDLPTALEQVPQAVPGPYNARAVGLVNGLNVLFGTPTPVPGLPDLGVGLISADAVRGEAVGVCRAGTAVYSANSEIVALKIGGMDVALNQPITGLVDTLNTLLQPLSAVVDIERNEVIVTAQGAIVNALHLTVLGGIGNPATTPLLDLVVGTAAVNGLQCPRLPQCSDTQDNDGDGKIDAQDPGCINDRGVYDPNDDDETDPLPKTAAVPTAELPRTGGDSTAPLAGGLAVLALGALALRRRSLAGR